MRPLSDMKVTKNEIKENAFFIWYKSSRNDAATMRELNKAGVPVTRKTIGEWKQKHNWVERATSLDLQKVLAVNTALDLEADLIKNLTEQKKKYEEYFVSLPANKVDNAATATYSALAKQLTDITEKIKKASGALQPTVKQSDILKVVLKFIEPKEND